MYKSIVFVKPLDNFHLSLTFENGEHRKLDMRPYLEMGIFQELKEEKMFNTVRISFDSIAWDNDADLDPEMLYSRSQAL